MESEETVVLSGYHPEDGAAPSRSIQIVDDCVGIQHQRILDNEDETESLPELGNATNVVSTDEEDDNDDTFGGEIHDEEEFRRSRNIDQISITIRSNNENAGAVVEASVPPPLCSGTSSSSQNGIVDFGFSCQPSTSASSAVIHASQIAPTVENIETSNEKVLIISISDSEDEKAASEGTPFVGAPSGVIENIETSNEEVLIISISDSEDEKAASEGTPFVGAPSGVVENKKTTTPEVILILLSDDEEAGCSSSIGNDSSGNNGNWGDNDQNQTFKDSHHQNSQPESSSINFPSTSKHGNGPCGESISGSLKRKRIPSPTRKFNRKRRAPSVSSQSSSIIIHDANEKTRKKPDSGKERKIKTNEKTASANSKISFQKKACPHLKKVSTILNFSDFRQESITGDLPPQLFQRRFLTTAQPVFEKLLQCTETKIPETVTGMPSQKDGFWEQWQSDRCCPTEFSCGRRIYYVTLAQINLKKAQGRFQNRVDGNPVVSFLKGQETDNGNPSYCPEVLSSIGSAELNTTLNLAKLAKELDNIEYTEGKNYLKMQLRELKIYGVLDESGKLIVVGAKSLADFRTATRRFARKVEKSGNAVHLKKLNFNFFVGLAKLPFCIDLKAMVKYKNVVGGVMCDLKDHPDFISINVTKTSILCFIFTTGDVIMTNAATVEDFKSTLDLIYPCLRKFGYEG